MATSALASGFGIFVQGAEGLGQGNAVIAHTAGASSVYFNPALIPRLEAASGLEVGTTLVKAERSFTSDLTGLETSANDRTYFPSTLYYYSQIPKLEDLWFGLAVNSTFGLGTNWPSTWEGRYIATRNEFTTFNINPNIAWKMGERFSAAIGLDFLYMDIDSNRALPSKLFTLNPLTPDAHQQITGDTWAYGFNVALAFEATEQLGFGLSYRSKFDVDFKDMDVSHTDVVAALLPVTPNTKASTKFSLPQQLTLGLAYDFSDDLIIEVALRWEDWSQYGNTTIYLEDAVLFQTSETIMRDWKSTLAYSLGGKYRISPQWSLLAGFLYSESGVPDDTFDPSIPDTDAYLYTIGGTYEGANWTFDFAYGLQDHEDRNKSNAINVPAGLAGELANGSYAGTIHLLAASVGYQF